jgi:hypothetical protein
MRKKKALAPNMMMNIRAVAQLGDKGYTRKPANPTSSGLITNKVRSLAFRLCLGSICNPLALLSLILMVRAAPNTGITKNINNTKLIAYFALNRPVVSQHSGRVFRSIPATHFGAFRPPPG